MIRWYRKKSLPFVLPFLSLISSLAEMPHHIHITIYSFNAVLIYNLCMKTMENFFKVHPQTQKDASDEET